MAGDLAGGLQKGSASAASRPDADPGNDPVIMEYLEERGLLRRPKPPNRRTRKQDAVNLRAVPNPAG